MFTHNKKLASKRSQHNVEAKLHYFLDAHEDFLKYHHFGPQHIVNYDETRVGPKYGKTSSRKYFTGKCGGRNNIRLTRSAIVTSLLPFVSAAGTILVVFYIIPAKFQKQRNYQQVEVDQTGVEFSIMEPKRFTRDNGFREYFCFTTTGYLNQELFKHIMQIFSGIWDMLYPGKEVLLLGDNSSTHLRPETILNLASNMKYLNFFPPNCTHFIQPLDASPFGSFKNSVYTSLETRQLYENILLRVTNDRDTVALAQKALRETISKDSIVSSFKTTGIYPYKPARILENFHRTNSNELITVAGQYALNMVHRVATHANEYLNGELAAKTIKVKLVVTKNFCYSADDVQSKLKKKEKEAEEKEELKKQKEAEKQKRKHEKFEKQEATKQKKAVRLQKKLQTQQKKLERLEKKRKQMTPKMTRSQRAAKRGRTTEYSFEKTNICNACGKAASPSTICRRCKHHTHRNCLACAKYCIPCRNNK